MAKVKISFKPVPIDSSLYLDSNQKLMQPAGGSLVYTDNNYSIKNGYLNLQFSATGTPTTNCSLVVTVDGQDQKYEGQFSAGTNKAIVADSVSIPIPSGAPTKGIPYP